MIYTSIILLLIAVLASSGFIPDEYYSKKIYVAVLPGKDGYDLLDYKCRHWPEFSKKCKERKWRNDYDDIKAPDGAYENGWSGQNNYGNSAEYDIKVDSKDTTGEKMLVKQVDSTPKNQQDNSTSASPSEEKPKISKRGYNYDGRNPDKYDSYDCVYEYSSGYGMGRYGYRGNYLFIFFVLFLL
ncbi:hypothetical protein AX774_g7773 [Zancudomyces culisetae]|uniref:Uncharacterized protein n=1 Tax=Zancudomyces culisetae TaxID=1213189 RepID=A0A1R1PD41_ZANCU|nr:hypothetical protein AX774_g7773 [Zancudomyces culisetae]|eukprot:OMH78829.1 hypothetical protein AX774_g7773 [Zancudomyces culisetae]